MTSRPIAAIFAVYSIRILTSARCATAPGVKAAGPSPANLPLCRCRDSFAAEVTN